MGAGTYPNSVVTPAKAGAHLEISGWVPAFAGMTAGGYFESAPRKGDHLANRLVATLLA